MPLRHSAPLTALALVTAFLLSSCGSDEEPPATGSTTGSPSSSASTTPSEEPSVAAPSETPDDSDAEVTLTRAAGKFTPNGERIELDIGQTLAVTITSDVAGELHVHSTPEQTIAYDAGTSEHEITIDRPGLVEVENHEPPLVVFQLEVR